jgi:hypothetical protein
MAANTIATAAPPSQVANERNGIMRALAADFFSMLMIVGSAHRASNVIRGPRNTMLV